MVANEVIDAAERWTSARVRALSPSLRDALAEWLAPSLDLVDDAEWGASGRDIVKVPVDDPLLWANRRLGLADGEWAVTGIRFRGLDIAKPFVDVIATSVSPDADGCRRLAEVLRHYADFAPLCLRVASPDPDGLLDAIEASEAFTGSGSIDLRLVAGSVEELRERPPVDGADRLELVPVDPRVAAERVAAIYAELTASRPALLDWAQPEGYENLASCAEEGLLFEVRVDGVSGGIVAAAREDAHGLRGFCVQEICLDADHRGRGLGPAVVHELSRRLPASRDDVLWGHIHPENEPSLRNALRAGREVVGGYVWITPDGYPGMPA